MTTVITYGTFDLFHIGHARLLQRVHSLGNRVIVGCSTDEFNAQKGKKSMFSYEDRAEILSACKYVSGVIPEDSWDQKVGDVKKYNVDIFAMGDDWVGKFDFLSEHTKVVYLPRTSGISTTEIKSVMTSFKEEKLFEVRNVMGHLTRLIDTL
ncbi:MAG: glycerol-3-phosphate cytidylyltransferase [Pseudomonadota bacterium]